MKINKMCFALLTLTMSGLYAHNDHDHDHDHNHDHSHENKKGKIPYEALSEDIDVVSTRSLSFLNIHILARDLDKGDVPKELVDGIKNEYKGVVNLDGYVKIYKKAFDARKYLQSAINMGVADDPKINKQIFKNAKALGVNADPMKLDSYKTVMDQIVQYIESEAIKHKEGSAIKKYENVFKQIVQDYKESKKFNEDKLKEAELNNVPKINELIKNIVFIKGEEAIYINKVLKQIAEYKTKEEYKKNRKVHKIDKIIGDLASLTSEHLGEEKVLRFRELLNYTLKVNQTLKKLDSDGDLEALKGKLTENTLRSVLMWCEILHSQLQFKKDEKSKKVTALLEQYRQSVNILLLMNEENLLKKSVMDLEMKSMLKTIEK